MPLRFEFLLNYWHGIENWAVRLWNILVNLPMPIQASLLGFIWVLVNLGLFWWGLATGHLYRYFIFAGALDGAVVSVIVVSFASEKFQAAVTGLLGGIGIDNIASQETLARKSISAVAQTIRGVVRELQIQIPIPGVTTEDAQKILEVAVIYAVWTALFVILASLVGYWAISSVRAATKQ